MTRSHLYGKGLRHAEHRRPSWHSRVSLTLVFFYAPMEAEQGFLQKIFYVHVPFAIVSLCGFVLGGLLAIRICARAMRAGTCAPTS